MCVLIIITGLIIDISLCILIAEYGGYAIQTKNKMGVPAMVYYENFYNYFYIKILLDFDKFFIEQRFARDNVCMFYAYIIFDAVHRPVLKVFTVVFLIK